MELVKFHESTEWDPTAFLQDLLMDPWEAAASMPNYLSSRTSICEEFESTTKRAIFLMNSTKTLNSRHIRPYRKSLKEFICMTT